VLVEKGAEAASEAQDNVLLSAALPEALGAGCAMNRFFNKLLGHFPFLPSGEGEVNCHPKQSREPALSGPNGGFFSPTLICAENRPALLPAP
jgi:hypothetical protein